MTHVPTERLAPCPFCGGKAEIIRSWGGGKDRVACCTEGDCLGHQAEQDEQGGWACSSTTDAESAVKWNRRAPSSELLELREAIKPFAALGQYMIDEGFVSKPDDATMWGFDRHDLSYGDFRRAARTIQSDNPGGES